MSDKALTCRDCGQSFIFTAGEQEFYAQKGFMNAPTRCPDCRATRKTERGGGGGGGGSASFGRGGSREMFPAVCSRCGRDTEVPFQPTTGKPVYCSDCFRSERGGSSAGRGDDRRERRY